MKNMKWYFASRTRHRKKLIIIADYLKNNGQLVNSDWIYENLPKPFVKYPGRIGRFTNSVAKAILDSDIFVLISDRGGTDMFVELGICIARRASSKRPRIYIVGEHSKRTVMQLHPAIIHLKTLREVFKNEKIPYVNFKFPNLN